MPRAGAPALTDCPSACPAARAGSSPRVGDARVAANGVVTAGTRRLGLPPVSNPGAATARRPLTGLVFADVISTTGTEMTAVALPWFVLVTTGSPARMGIVLAAEYAGLSVLGLAGARVATAVGPRRLMLGSDLS